jgi:ferredoxin
MKSEVLFLQKKMGKYTENVPGSYYVNKKCIVCGNCVAIAPNNFAFTEGDKHAYLYNQPDGKSEVNLCKKALESCPADAIVDK